MHIFTMDDQRESGKDILVNNDYIANDYDNNCTSTTLGNQCNVAQVQTQTSVPDSNMVGRYSNKRAYLSVAILCFINLINYIDRYTIAAVLGDVKTYYNLNDKWAGFLQTSFILSYLLMAPVFGYLGDRYNRRLIMAAGILFWCVTSYLGSVVPQKYPGLFMLTRALVGTGEASYSTIAPTVIADLFTDTQRTKMLSLFYFAIPVGSGLGYITGTKAANLFGQWNYALKVTPVLGCFAVFLCLIFLIEPPRGVTENGVTEKSGSFIDDVIAICKIPSFIWVTLGFTCVTFSVGALAWWVPDFIDNAMKVHGKKSDKVVINMVFGTITCFAGITGVVLGSLFSQFFRKFNAKSDPLICAYSMLLAVPLVFAATVVASTHIVASYTLIFFGVTLLCMNWVLVADIVLYVVVPERRSMAEAIQITLSHALGDACSPYIVGVISDAVSNGDESPLASYTSMQYSLFLPIFILIAGAGFFFINSFYVVEDRDRCTRQSRGDTSTALVTNVSAVNLQEDMVERI